MEKNDNKVKVHEIDTWSDFINKISELEIKKTGDKSFSMPKGYIFRGHAN